MKVLLFLWAITVAESCSFAAIVTPSLARAGPEFSDTEANNPQGLAIGPDGALYFCDLCGTAG